MGDAAPGPHRDVVQDGRQVTGGTGHRSEMLRDADLRRTVVIRGDQEHAVHATFAGQRGHLHRVLGVIRSAAGDDRNGDGFGHGAPQVGLLVVGQHRTLAGRASEHEPVAAVGGQPLGQFHGRIEVKCTGEVERGHHGGDHPSESRRSVIQGHYLLTLPVEPRPPGALGSRS